MMRPVRRLALLALLLCAAPALAHGDDPYPTIPGWRAPQQSATLMNITGDDLGRVLGAALTAQPPWALLRCTLQAAAQPGCISRAELVFVTTEPAPASR